MAMTLEDVLGRNTQQVNNRITQFPSFEEFSGRSYNNAQQTVQDASMNDYDYFAPRPYTQPMSTEQVRDYNARQAYYAPQQNEYAHRNIDSIIDQYVANQQNQKLDEPDVSLDNEFSPRFGREEYKPLSLFEFTVQDKDRLSNGELESKLSYSASSQMTMAFNGEVDAISAPIYRPEKKQSRLAQKLAQLKAQKEEKQRKLGLKGKILIGVYVAVIVALVILIGVNAKKINSGNALVPSGNQIEISIDK